MGGDDEGFEGVMSEQENSELPQSENWMGQRTGVPPPGAFAPLAPNTGNYKHGRSSEFRQAMKILKIGEFIEGPLPEWERQAKRMSDQVGIRVATRRVKSKMTVRIYRTA